jgi:hypothetical protein
VPPGGVWRAAVSATLSASRALPAAVRARCWGARGSIWRFRAPSPRSYSCSARSTSRRISSSSNGLRRQHPRPRKQRVGENEERVLGGRPDQGEGAVFQIAEQGILLRAVREMDFVQQQKGGLPTGTLAMSGEFRQTAYLLNADRDRALRLHERTRIVGNKIREAGLAAIGWRSGDNRAKCALLDRLRMGMPGTSRCCCPTDASTERGRMQVASGSRAPDGLADSNRLNDALCEPFGFAIGGG